ncbi:YjgF-like protein [Ascobolus immersus RN42]|uniref:YjgF-like protein n=1 Tax=Ascobolus immersus RN42 TaxID=1160509 RepID=A0A3N4ILT3_ASCIM|nr:YjgF-like protein [Ascobolus immersus RN42]
MATKQIHTTSNPYERLFGYSRAIRKGPFIFISGTTCIPASGADSAPPASAYEQTKMAYQNAVDALLALGGKVEDVVRVRMYVRDEADCDEVGRGMKEFFEGMAGGEVGFAATMVAGLRFVRGELLVEVEVDAVGDL